MVDNGAYVRAESVGPPRIDPMRRHVACESLGPRDELVGDLTVLPGQLLIELEPGVGNVRDAIADHVTDPLIPGRAAWRLPGKSFVGAGSK